MLNTCDIWDIQNLKKNSKVICEICQKSIALTESSLYLSCVRKFLAMVEKQSKELSPHATRERQHAMIPIQCEQCMKERNTIPANRSKQNIHGYLCYARDNILYYQDKTLHCKSCKKDFLFSASEQKYWYEEAQIFTDVQPKFCAPCRKKNRQQTAINKKLMSLTQKETLTKDDIEQIVEIYTQLWNKTQAGIYKAKLKQL